MGGQGNNLFPRNKNLFHFMVVYLKPPWSWLRGLWLWLWSPFGGSPGMAQTPWWAKEGRWWVHLRGIYLAAVAGHCQGSDSKHEESGSWGCHDVTTEAAEPINRALSHSLKGSHPPPPLPPAPAIPPLHPRPILQTSWNQISTLFPAIITTFSYNFYPALKEDHRFGSIGQF